MRRQSTVGRTALLLQRADSIPLLRRASAGASLASRSAVSLLLTDFRSLHPSYCSTQAQTLEWLSEAHTQAEATLARQAGRTFDPHAYRAEIARRLARFGCGPDKIGSRGHALADIHHTRWSDMDIYRLEEDPQGVDMHARTQRFAEITDGALCRLLAEREPPADLLHVTCTGYASPSAAQRLVARNGWGPSTRVFHVYHMGCYASFPAIRAARGFLQDRAHGRARGHVEIVHTELCSLHLNPTLHTPEQLVVQTLFADGYIAYRACQDSDHAGSGPALRVLAMHEEILPDSADAMTWICSGHGMQMSLSREVPQRIAGEIERFVRHLLEQACLPATAMHEAVFAVHPGGPRILDQVGAVLGLQAGQLSFSRSVLHARGNMSSATLPHVWMDIAHSPEVPEGHPVVSLAFGPGLTICGAVCQKEQG